jgi:MATE family multidrug resistance protein
MAQALGGRQFRAIRRTARQGFWVAIAYTVPVGLLLWNAEQIFVLFGAADESTALAQAYLRAAVWSLLPGLWIVVLRSFVSAHSRPRSVLVVTILGVGVNALGNYTLMFGNFGFPALGVVGAGVSTSIVNIVMFAVLIAFVLRDRQFRRYYILVRFWRSDWPRFREILRVGMPIGLAILAEAGMFAGAALLMWLIGTNELAAHGIALQCAAVAFMVQLGISHAATVRVGLAAGRGNPGGVHRAGWVALALGGVYSVVPIAVFWIMPLTLVDLFLDLEIPGNREVAEVAVVFLGVAAVFQFVDGIQVTAVGTLRGLKDTRVPMIIATIGYWAIGFATSALLGLMTPLGGQGVWIGLALGLAVVALAATYRFHHRARLVRGYAAWAGAPA